MGFSKIFDNLFAIPDFIIIDDIIINGNIEGMTIFIQQEIPFNIPYLIPVEKFKIHTQENANVIKRSAIFILFLTPDFIKILLPPIKYGSFLFIFTHI